MLYACDWYWWKEYGAEAARVVAGEHWTCSTKARDEFRKLWIQGDQANRGLSKHEDRITTGMNSGYQAIGLAHLWGARRIVLLGFDFQRTGGKAHWHADHPRGMSNGGNFPVWATQMAQLADDLKATGVDVVNCSRATALKCFPRTSLAAALAK